MLGIMSFGDREIGEEPPVLLTTVTKSMSTYKDMEVDRDDLFEEVAEQIPDDLKISYSIRDEGFLKVHMNGEDSLVKGPGSPGLNPSAYKYKLGLSIGEFIFRSEFKDERSLEQQKVESGIGRIMISKKQSSPEV